MYYGWLLGVIAVLLINGLIGYAIGKNKGLGATGFFIGLIGPIGWIIVAVMNGTPTHQAPPPQPSPVGRPSTPDRTSVATRIAPSSARAVSNPVGNAETRLYNRSRSTPASGWLCGISGTSRGRQFRLTEGDNEIGRSSSCAISLNDGEMSRHHSLIRISQGRSVLYDLASANGTFLNGELMLEPSVLYDGDELVVGGTTFQYKQIG